MNIKNSKLISCTTDIQRQDIISVQINLLNACTSKCVYCKKNEWPRDVLDSKIVIRTLGWLADQGCKTIVFSGGDIVLYKDFEDVVTATHELGMMCSIISTLITKNYDLINFIAHHVDRIHTSIDGSNAEEYKNCRGVDGFDIVVENLKTINKIRYKFAMSPVRISSVISTLNYKSLYDLCKLAYDTNSHIKFYTIHDDLQYKITSDTSSELRDEIQRCIEYDKENRTNLKDVLSQEFGENIVPKSKFCTIPYIHALINANGDIYPCCKLMDDNGPYGPQLKYSYGNIYKENLHEEFSKRFATVYDICNYCHGCTERYNSLIDDVNTIMYTSTTDCFL